MNRVNSWSLKHIDILKNQYPVITNPRDLIKLTGRSYTAIKTMARKLGLKREVPNYHPSTATTSEDKYITKNYLTLPLKVIAENLNNRTYTFVKKRLDVMGLVRPPELIQKIKDESRIKKGNVSFNKGRKRKDWLSPEQIEKVKLTQFKVGTIPPNHRKVGSERIDAKDGYIYVKVAEGINQFKLKHRVVYERHFGPIPKGYNVEFKDRNRLNFEPANLVLRTRKQNMLLNTIHNYPKEIAALVQLRGALNRQINKKRV